MKKSLLISLILLFSMLPKETIAYADTASDSIVSSNVEEFSLRNGIYFGDSVETVKEKETFTFQSSTSSSTLKTNPGKVSGFDDTTVVFYFKDDQLEEMTYWFEETSSKDSVNSEYDAIYRGLTRKYGEPLGFSGGSTYIINTTAFKNSLLAAYLKKALGGVGDYVDYDEWLVKVNNDYYVKIDILSTYEGESYSEAKYSLIVGYKMITEDEIIAAKNEKQEKLNEVDNDL